MENDWSRLYRVYGTRHILLSSREIWAMVCGPECQTNEWTCILAGFVVFSHRKPFPSLLEHANHSLPNNFHTPYLCPNIFQETLGIWDSLMVHTLSHSSSYRVALLLIWSINNIRFFFFLNFIHLLSYLYIYLLYILGCG